METGKKIGLALGGGVVRGLAHIGVLQVLEDAGIRVDMVAGTSAGAIAAVNYAAGWDGAKLQRFAEKMSWFSLARPVWPVAGFVNFSGLRQLMEKHLGNPDLQDLPMPCLVTATDIDTGEPVYLRSGPAALAVQASCSVPGFVEPVRWQNRRLCEGGISDMLPVTPLRQMGAEYVIAVDIFAFHLRRWLGPLGYLMAGAEITLQRSGGGTDEADCLISPALAGLSYIRFGLRRKLIELGRRAALAKLPILLKDLGMDASQPIQSPQEPGQPGLNVPEPVGA